MHKKLLVVVPCFNEAAVLPSTFAALQQVRSALLESGMISADSMLLFVDDGSRDHSWELIRRFCAADNRVSALKLSRNFGQQYALLAGLLEAKNAFDLYLSLDADLQDDPEVIPQMLQAYYKGAEIVYAVRRTRLQDSCLKKYSAQLFYHIMHRLKVGLLPQHADFRLISQAVLQAFSGFKERNLFLRGIFPALGFPTAKVYYARKPRKAGQTKYPLGRMLAFAWEGLTSFSVYPLRLILYSGVLTLFLACLLALWVLYTYLTGRAVPGWSSILLPIAAFGGLQMVSLGIIGEYLGKIYKEVKGRPRYIVEKKIWADD